MSSTKSLKQWAKSVVEKTARVSVSRAPRFPRNNHADEALQGLRQWSSTDVVFDVGANDGRTVLRLNEPLARPRFFAFEPVSATFQTLVRRTASLDNVRCLQLALGAASGRETIYLNAIDTMNSLSPQWAEAEGSETVEVSTVDQVMAEQGVDFIHFLKIDTEGFELEVLKGAQAALAAGRIQFIQAEVGFGQSTREFTSLETMRAHLAPHGYYLYGIYNQCRTRHHVGAPTGESANGTPVKVLGYCDALFVKSGG